MKTSLLIFVLSYATLAPVPTWLFPEPARVGTRIKYGYNFYEVKEIRYVKGTKQYRLGDCNLANDWRGKWATEKSVLEVIADDNNYFKWIEDGQ